MRIAWVLVIVLGVLFSAVFQQSAVGRSLFLGQSLDLQLVTVVLLGLRMRPGAAATVGFVSGVLQGGASGANLTAYCASKTIVGFAVGFVSRSGLALNPVSTAGICAVTTVVSQLLLLFMAPPPDIGRFLGATLGTAIYNGVIAGILDAILRKTLEKQVD